MKIARFRADGYDYYGQVEGDRLRAIQGDLFSNISQYCTLHRGDLITTGAPGSIRPLRPGDVVEVETPGIGVLRSPIAAAR